MEPEVAALMRRSQELESEDEFGDEALAVNGALVSHFPRSPEANIRLAHCLLATGEFRAAVLAYERVLACSKSDDVTAKIARRKRAEAQERFDSTQETRFKVVQDRALKLKAEAKIEEALVWHERAVAVAKDSAERTLALASWAASLRGLRRFEDAHELLRRSLQVDSSLRTNRLSHAVLVATLVDLGQLQQAVTASIRLLEVHGGDVAVLKASGRAFYALAAKNNDADLRERAEECFKRAGSRWT